MSSLKSKIKLLLFSSGFYFALAIIANLFVIFKLAASYNLINIDLGDSDISESTGILGLLLVFFLVTFVSMIIVLNKIETNKKSNQIFKIFRIFLAINIAFSFFWFSKVKDEIGGTPRFDGDKYTVYYRTEFVKNITEKQFYEYSQRNAEISVYIFSAFFLFFSGMMFLALLEAYQEISNTNKNTLN